MFVLLTEVKPCWVKVLLGWVLCWLVLFFFVRVLIFDVIPVL